MPRPLTLNIHLSGSVEIAGFADLLVLLDRRFDQLETKIVPTLQELIDKVAAADASIKQAITDEGAELKALFQAAQQGSDPAARQALSDAIDNMAGSVDARIRALSDEEQAP